VVLYNNASGIVSPTVAGTPAITIPVVSISAADGAAMNTTIAAGGATITWTSDHVSVANPTGGLISSFSSYGLSPDLALKPDIGAPGGFIWSTYPLELGGYASLSGTSMASPHVAGSAALMLQARPHTSSQAMRGLLQNTSVPKNWSGNPGLGFLDYVHRQGAGMIQIDNAVLATGRVTPAKLSLGEGETGPSVQTLTVSNDGSVDVTYDLSYVNALSTGADTFTVGANLGNAAVAFSAPSVTVPAGGSASFTATITPAASPVRGQYGGYIVLTPQDDGQVYRVPYAGFIGDYQSKVVLVPTSAQYPWLATLDADGNPVNHAGGWTFTMAGDDIAYFPIHLDHQSQLMRMEIADAATGKSWHRAFQYSLLPRNSGSTGFFLFGWDGVVFAGKKATPVPNGQYRATVSVLKALGDQNNPAHWETWTSPVITILRP